MSQSSSDDPDEQHWLLLIDLDEAIDWWIDPKGSRSLSKEQRQGARAAALKSGHIETDTAMQPILWLRLFYEVDAKVAPNAVSAMLEAERENQRLDRVLLYRRAQTHTRSAKPPPMVGVPAERFPGRHFVGYTTLELLHSPPAKLTKNGRHWPYYEEWDAKYRYRETNGPRTRSKTYVRDRWGDLTAVLEKCLDVEAKTETTDLNKALVEKVGDSDDSDRRFRTQLKLQDLTEQLQQRHAALARYSLTTLKQVVQILVRAPRGRPKASS